WRQARFTVPDAGAGTAAGESRRVRDRASGGAAGQAVRRRDSQGTASFVRDAPDGSWRRPGGDRIADGTPQPAGDGCVPARFGQRLGEGGGQVGGSTMKWDYWITLYVRTHCTARGLRATTIAAYQATLFQFRAFVEVKLERSEPDLVTARDVLEYLEFL